jgi:dephospho-CoA kinase
MSDSAAHRTVADPVPAAGARLTAAVTGGIGAGKSTVSRMLRELGAIVIDSDLLARRVVEPGTEGLAAVVAAFGRRVLSEDDTLDRAALAEIVFASADADEARSRLERIIHPLVRAEFKRIAGQAPPGSVVVNDIPILRSRAAADEFDAVVAVVADEPVRIARLIDRGLAEADARARIAAQIRDDERVALADYVIPNNGDEAELRRRVEALWQELLGRWTAGRGCRAR